MGEMTHGYEFSWSDHQSQITIRGNGFSTRRDADAALVKAATEFGYTKPKWWQFSRWRERPLPAPPAAAAKE